MGNILRVYDPSECDALGVPLDWECCRSCGGLGGIDASGAPSTAYSAQECGACDGHGSLKAAALAAVLTERRVTPLLDIDNACCEDCGHPMSEGTLEDAEKSPRIGDDRLRFATQKALEALRAGAEPGSSDWNGGVWSYGLHYSPCDEGCTHGGPVRCDSPSDLTAQWDVTLDDADADVVRGIVVGGVTVEASWRQVDVRALGWPHDLRPEKLAVLCLRHWADRACTATTTGLGDD